MAKNRYTKSRARQLLLAHLYIGVANGENRFYRDALAGEEGDEETTLGDLILMANGVRSVDEVAWIATSGLLARVVNGGVQA